MGPPVEESDHFLMGGLKKYMRMETSMWHVSKEEAKQCAMTYHRVAEVLLGLGSVPCHLPFKNRGFVSLAD